MRTPLALAVAGALLAAACGASEQDIEIPRYLTGSFVAPTPEIRHGRLIGMIGSLTLDGKCLYLSRTDSERVLIAFPADASTWNSEKRELRLGGNVIPFDEPYVFEGGTELPREPVRWVARPDDSCDEAMVWLSTSRSLRVADAPYLQTPSPTPGTLTYREALEKDAAEYARQHNVPLAEAIIVLERQFGLVSTPTANP